MFSQKAMFEKWFRENFPTNHLKDSDFKKLSEFLRENSETEFLPGDISFFFWCTRYRGEEDNRQFIFVSLERKENTSIHTIL